MTCGSGAAVVSVDGSHVEETWRQSAVPAILTQDEFALFAVHGRERTMAEGEVLFRRGDSGGAMYVIAAGCVDLDFGEDLGIKHLQQGEFFGELGLLMGEHRRSADALAASDGRLLELDEHDFQRLVSEASAVVAYFLRRSIMRVVLHEHDLIRQLRRRNRELEAALDNLYVTSHQLSRTEELIRTDELTGLYNRRGLVLHLQDCRANQAALPAGLLLIDCDRFKRVNDEHGHQAGDRVLQNVANILRSVAGPDDLACRLGGDEFCLLVGPGRGDDLGSIGEFILATMRGLLEVPQPTPHICQVSVGMSVVDPESDWDDWYAQADNALYEAKRRGGNRLHGPREA